MIESLLLKWNALSPRDRRMLVLAGGFLLIVLTWLLAFEPAWDGRRQLARELPALRSDLAQMDQLAEEARLAASAPRQGVESASQLRTRVEETLADSGLSGSVAQPAIRVACALPGAMPRPMVKTSVPAPLAVEAAVSAVVPSVGSPSVTITITFAFPGTDPASWT